MKSSLIISLRKFSLWFLFTSLLCSLTSTAWAQSAGDFRTRTNGEWDLPFTWQRFDGSEWRDTSVYPTAADGVVTILNGHTVEGTLSIAVDELIIENGGALEFVSDSLTVADGPGTDVIVNGILSTTGVIVNNGQMEINGTFRINANGLVNNQPVYGAASTLVYNTGGTFTVGDEWTGTASPGNVTIQNSTGLIMPAVDLAVPGNMAITSGTLTLNAGGGSLAVGGDWSDSGSFVPNGRTVLFNGTGDQFISNPSGEIFDILVIDKTGGTLTANNDITVAGSSGDVLRMLNSGNINLGGNNLLLENDGGSILVDGGFRSIGGGIVHFNGAKSITSSGGTLLFLENTELNDSVDFGPDVTIINVNLRLNAGGFVNTNPPVYNTGSVLTYYSGGIYNRGLEWSTTSGAGYPYHVVVSNNTILDLGANGGSAIPRQTAGNLFVIFGAELTMNGVGNEMTAPLTVLGDMSNAGILTLSGAPGGDLYVGGNFSNNFTFNPNGAAVLLNGTGTQTITSPGGIVFDGLSVDNATGSVDLADNITVNGLLTIINGTLNTGTNKVTLGPAGSLSEAGNGNIVLGTAEVSRTITSSGNETFGNIGVELDPNAGPFPGATTVTRVTGTPQTGAGHQGIDRSYNVSAAVNTGLDADMVFHYDDSPAELNGQNENTFDLFRSTDNGSTWSNENGTVDTAANTVAKNNISELSVWTISDAQHPLFYITSLTSDVVAVPASESLTISSLENDTPLLTATDGEQVWQVKVRDGGIAAPDSDSFHTELIALVLHQGASNEIPDWSEAVLNASLFSGSTFIDSGSISSSSISFSGFSFPVPDNDSSTLSLRISLKNPLGSGVADNQHFQFSLGDSDVTAGSPTTSSQFGSFAEQLSNASQNAIDVSATGLVVTTQPQDSQVVGRNIAPVTVTAKDANGNTDADYSTGVTLSSGTFSLGSTDGGGLTLVPVSGVASWTNLSSSTYGSGTILANSGVLAGAVTNAVTVLPLTVTASAGANGSISPAGIISLNLHANQSFTITPDTGYHVSDVLVDGISVGAVSNYDFNDVTANHTIAASFAINTYSITATAGSNGSVSPSGSVSVNHGSNQSFVISPDTGYHVADVLVDGISVGAVTNYDFNSVTTNHTISASFAINSYSITTTTGSNGSISPSGSVSVNHGSNQSFVITPDTGYHVAEVLVDGIPVGAVLNYDFTNVTANHTISASFAINTYTVTASAGPNGSISPSGAVSVNHGSAQSFGISPDAGYHIADVLVDGVSVGALSNYDFTNVTANHTISASFAINTYTLTISAANGSVVKNPDLAVYDHETLVGLKAIPDTGYHFVGWGGAVTGSLDTATVFMNGNKSVTAAFAINTYSITATAGSNGSISPAGTVSVNHGSNQSFVISPDTGYHVADVLVDGISVGTVTNYDFNNVTSNHTIAASFAINTYSITASAGSNGSISPSGSVSVNHGSNQSFVISPDTGYHVADVLVDGVSVGAVTNYDFNTVTANHTIAASFAINTYAITATAGTNGSINPSGSVGVNHGSNQSFVIMPDAGYHVADVLVDGVSVGAVTNYDFNNVTANHTIAASFAINTYAITATAGTNGSISPSGSVSVNYGGNQSFVIIPDTGYHVADVLVNGVSVGAVTNYDFNNVTSNHTIAASFAINTYTITASAGANGSISPSGAVSVNHGSNQSFIITPDTGYHVADVLVDGVSVGAVTNYDFNSVTTNHTIAASFAINTYSITASAGSNGSISPSGSVSVNHGSNQSFVITPDTGYHVADVLVDGISVGAVLNYGFTNVTASHTISASFAINTYSITATTGANGSITPSGSVSVNHGGNQSFTITPDAGYFIADVFVDSVSVGAVANYDFTNVTANHTIAASFAINTYSISGTAGSNGSISPSGAVSVNHGSNQSFVVSPNTGYHVADVLVDGNSVGPVLNYNFTNVTANHTIAASFAINTYSITASAGSNGSISPSGSVSVNHGSNQSFVITPDTGYHVADVLVDGISVGAVLNYDFTNVTANHTILATFDTLSYIITAVAGANGVISPEGNISVNYGEDASFTITPGAGYFIADVTVDSVSVGAVGSYTFNNVTANHIIAATFDTLSYVITASATGGGTITPSGTVSVNYGTDRSFAISPATGFFIQDLFVDSVSVGATGLYTFTNVTANHTIVAVFDTLSYVITAVAGANGTISPAGSIGVNYGGNVAFTITPNIGYFIADVHVDSVSVGAVGSYSFTNVVANHLIEATFVANTPPQPAILIEPVNGDTLAWSKAGFYPLLFLWGSAGDSDPGDTVTFTLHIYGTNLDSLITGLTLPSYSTLLRGLNAGATYYWTVLSSDGHVTVASPDTFNFVIDFGTGVGEQTGLPQEFALQQNYPNPFNPSTVIRYQLPVSSVVSLKIYNMLGQEIGVLVDEEQEAGFKSVEWSAANLPSGIYFYKLHAGSYSAVKKMMLVK